MCFANDTTNKQTNKTKLKDSVKIYGGTHLLWNLFCGFITFLFASSLRTPAKKPSSYQRENMRYLSNIYLGFSGEPGFKRVEWKQSLWIWIKIRRKSTWNYCHNLRRTFNIYHGFSGELGFKRVEWKQCLSLSVCQFNLCDFSQMFLNV